MGTFGKSFSRELGKNTGKWASTKLFGDKHATPHRIIYKSEAGGRGSSGSAAAQPKQPGLLGGIGKGVGDMMGGTMSMMQAELKKEQEEKALKREEKAKKEEKLEDLSSFSVGDTPEVICENLNYLASTAKAQKDKNVRSVCIEKIEFGIMKLSSSGAQAEAAFFQKKLDELKTKKKGLFGFGK